MNFKFFQKSKPQGNYYLSFDMDEVAINVIRYAQHNNQILFNNNINLAHVNVPINNCWLRITDLRSFISTQPEMIEVYYRVIEVNNTPTDFSFRMETQELLRRISHNSYEPI